MATRHAHRCWTLPLVLALLFCAIAPPVHAVGYGGEIIWSEDFESGWGDWYTDAGVWEVGKPTSGPGKAHSGQAVAATDLSANYPADTDSRLVSPVLTLPTVSKNERLEFRYQQWYSYAYRDNGYVQVARWDGSKWGAWATILTPNVSETNSAWSLVSVDLTAYAGQVIQVALYHTADSPSESSGWYIDDVQVWKGIPVFTNPETFEFGWGDWTTDSGVWQIGKPTSGPTASHTGQAVAATNLSGNYPADTDSRLISPAVTLPTVGEEEQLQLRYRQWYSYAYRDKGLVQIAKWDGGKWGAWATILTPNLADTGSTWSPVSADLTAYAGQTVKIAFYHTADSPSEGHGWYVDDVQVWKGIPVFANPETFEFGWGDWTTDSGVWQIGTPTKGPDSAHGGRSVAATSLVGNYPADTDSRLISPAVTLPNSPALKLRFWQWYSYAYRDKGSVQISKWDGAHWSNWATLSTPANSEMSSDWSLVAIPQLASYGGQTVRIAFFHTADAPSESAGWYIDDVEITPTPETWWISEDSGVSRTDKRTNDTTPELTFVFPHTVNGQNSDIEITDSEGVVMVPDSVSGWGTDKVVVSFTTPLSKDDQYTVTLKGTIADSQGQPIHGGTDRIYHFTLDTTGPALTCETHQTEDTTPEIVGNVDDPEAVVEVTIGVGNNTQTYRVINVGDGTWVLPDDIISPALSTGMHIIAIAATDACGNVGMRAAQMHIGPPPSTHEMTVSSSAGGSVTTPGEGTFEYQSGQVVCLEVEADDGYRFVRWEGTAVDADKLNPDATDPSACVTVDGNYTLTAVFEPRCVVVYDFPMDSGPGWALEGQWEFGVPTGQRCSAWGEVDPTSGYTGSNVLGVNLDGCYNLVIGGPYYATAGPFDLSGYEDVTLRFWRWLNCDIPEYVRCTVEISTDTQNWTVLWTQGEREEITDEEWTLCEYAIPEADCDPTVYLRWSYEIIQERAYAYTGWNIDDVQLIGCGGCN